MRFDPDKCPECGKDPRGTIDEIPGCALIDRQEDGSFEWAGETDVWWDGQMTVRDDEQRVTLTCHWGHEWQAKEVTT